MGTSLFNTKAASAVLALILLANASIPASAQKLINMAFPDATTLILRFDNPDAVSPELFSSSLSDDKTSIKLDLLQVDYSSEYENESRAGKINGIYFTNVESHLQIDLKLNDSYGYTCVPQPLSSSIVVNIFKWNELDAGEDNYRAAQLALESEIKGEAVSSLVDAIDNGNKSAKALLAYLNMDDNPGQSAARFSECSPTDTELPDVAFAAADLLAREGKEKASAAWMKRYEELTGMIVASESDEPSTHLEDLMADKKEDTIEEKSEADIAVNTKETEEARNWEDLFLLIGLSFTSIAFVTIIMVAVQKKRARKIQEEAKIAEESQKELESESFEDQLAAAKLQRNKQMNDSRNSTMLIAEIADNAKKQQQRDSIASEIHGNRVDRTIADTPSLQKQQPDPVTIDEETGSANVHVEEKKADIEDFLKTFIPQKKQEESTGKRDMAASIRSVISQVEAANLENPTTRNTAEMELALKIAQKESQNKFSKLRKLDLGKLEGSQRLDELSKQLNIDSTALSAKKKVAELQVNKGRISKLSKRFDVN